MYRTGLAALALTALLPSSSWAETIKVKEGDTLSQIAYSHKVPISTIMQLNGLKNANELSAGIILKLPDQNHKINNGEIRTHKVRNGETLISIAKMYKVNKNDLIGLNRLKDSNYLYLGQEITIPSINEQDSNDVSNLKKAPSPIYHIVKKGDTLSKIAKQYNLSIENLIQFNQLIAPDTLKINTKLSLKNTAQENKSTNNKIHSTKPIQSDWRTYGPLRLDWANWQAMGKSYVAPTINTQGKALYIAVNCPAKKINATGANGSWKNWSQPFDEFEYSIIRDICKEKRT